MMTFLLGSRCWMSCFMGTSLRVCGCEGRERVCGWASIASKRASQTDARTHAPGDEDALAREHSCSCWCGRWVDGMWWRARLKACVVVAYAVR